MEYDIEYIKPEIRDDWEVSEKKKKVWWILLDLMKVLDKICKENNLRWYPAWGTLLGVIRHKGFIPWDDDVDIVMPREDYEKFIVVCQSCLEEPYYLQTTLTDQECYYMWISLRNSMTTGNREASLTKKQNNGIGIDIMPLDGCQNNYIHYLISRYPMRIVTVLTNTYVNDINKSTLAKCIRKVLRLFKLDYKKNYIWANKQNSRYRFDCYEKVAFRALADPYRKHIKEDMWLKEDFEKTIDMPFENIVIPVPSGYDRLLKTIYGDYMEFPPIEKRNDRHDVIFEPDIPYKDYCSKYYGVVY